MCVCVGGGGGGGGGGGWCEVSRLKIVENIDSFFKCSDIFGIIYKVHNCKLQYFDKCLIFSLSVCLITPDRFVCF